MQELSQWIPTIVAAAGVIGLAAVADSNIKRLDVTVRINSNDIQDLKTEVAVLKEKLNKK